jgi:hypothetical protein
LGVAQGDNVVANRTDASDQQEQVAEQDGQEEFLDAILTHVMQDLDSARSTREEKESDWDRYFNMWMSHLESSKYPWKSKVYDPEAYATLETIHARVMNTMLIGPEIFAVKPTEETDVANSRKSGNLLNYQADRMNLYEKLSGVDRDGLMYGTGFAKVRWRKDYEPRIIQKPILGADNQPITDPDTGEPITEEVKDYVLTYDNPHLDRVDVKSMYVDPDATSMEDARFVIQKSRQTLDYLKKKELEGIYYNIDAIPKNDSSDSFYDDDDQRKQTINEADSNNIDLHDEQMKHVTLLEYWGLYDIDQDGVLEECLITIANGATVIRADYNPFPGGFKPFLRFTPIPIPGEFYGMSLFKSIEGIQDALNDRTNQIADSISLALNPMWKASRLGEIDPDQLISSPGNVIDVNNITDLEPLEKNDITGSVFPEIQRLEGKIKMAAGVYDYAVGASPQRQEAATTVISLQQVAEIRFRQIIMMFERQVIRPLGNMMLKLDKALMPPMRQIRILGRNAVSQMQEEMFEQISPQDIVESPDIYAVGASLEVGMSKQAQLDNLMKFLQIWTSVPGLMLNPMFSLNYALFAEEIPYLLNLRLKGPPVLPNNPQLAYNEVQGDKQLADQMMINQMGHMAAQQVSGPQEPPDEQGGAAEAEKKAPSRTKGELAKKKGKGKKKK